MSYSVSRRQFLQGLGIVAAATALSACSSGSGKTISNAITNGTVGGLVTTDHVFTRNRNRIKDQIFYEFSLMLTLKNVSSQTVSIGSSNFATKLDNAPISLSDITVLESGDIDSGIWGSILGTSLSINPGEEVSISLDYNIDQTVYDDWNAHSAVTTFTCGDQSTTYTK